MSSPGTQLAPAKGAAAALTPPPDILPTLFGAGYGTYGVRKSNFIFSFIAHSVGLVLLLVLTQYTVEHHEQIKQNVVTLMSDISPYVMPAAKDASGGGGGGGDHDKLAASKDNLPKFARDQVPPPAGAVRHREPK